MDGKPEVAESYLIDGLKSPPIQASFFEEIQKKFRAYKISFLRSWSTLIVLMSYLIGSSSR